MGTAASTEVQPKRRRVRRAVARSAMRAVEMVPRPLRFVAGAAFLVVAAFGLTFLPFFSGGAPAHAEVAGRVPLTAVSGQVMQVPIGIDDSGGVTLDRLCLAVTLTGVASARDAVVQGFDRLTFHGGIACGGTLPGGESVSAVVDILPTRPGPLTMSIGVVRPDGRSIGPTLTGTTQVNAE